MGVLEKDDQINFELSLTFIKYDSSDETWSEIFSD